MFDDSVSGSMSGSVFDDTFILIPSGFFPIPPMMIPGLLDPPEPTNPIFTADFEPTKSFSLSALPVWKEKKTALSLSSSVENLDRSGGSGNSAASGEREKAFVAYDEDEDEEAEAEDEDGGLLLLLNAPSSPLDLSETK